MKPRSFLKRAIDVALASPGLVASLPVLALAAVAIKLDSEGPVLFRQTRVGRGAQPFTIYKLRTMTTNAEKVAGSITIGADARVTRVGKFLRKSKIDELPQLFNVLKGDMSLIGPRPEVKTYVELYDEEQKRVLDLVPGITDPASIKYRDESEVLAKFEDPHHAYVTEIMPEKIRINLEYAERATWVSDLGVLFRTALAVAPGAAESNASTSKNGSIAA